MLDRGAVVSACGTGPLIGPMLIVERFTSWWVDVGWGVESVPGGALLLRRLAAS